MKKGLLTMILITLLLTLLVSCNVEAPPNGGSESGSETPTGESVFCEHTYGEWITEKEATCTDGGSEYAECTKCGEKKTKIKIALDHIRRGDKCTRCGCTLESIGLEFTSNGDGTCSVSGLGTCIDIDIVIPSKSPEGDTVVSIGDKAFWKGVYIKSVYIPECVKSIGDYAFYGQSMLEKINIPNGVTSIGEAAFMGCNGLRTVVLPENLCIIEICAFSDCENLMYVYFENTGIWSVDDMLTTPDEDENIKVEFTDDEKQNAEYLTSTYSGFYRFTRK